MNEPIMQYFKYDHLPPHLQVISKPFCELAKAIVGEVPWPEDVITTGGAAPGIARNPERTVSLRKLLESKDAAIRAFLTPVPA